MQPKQVESTQPTLTTSPLLKLTSPLFSVLAYAPDLHHVSNPILLYQNLVYTIQNIETQLRDSYPSTHLKLANYLLCIALDECIIDPLNIQHNIEINRTLDYLYQDAQGEKRFFRIVDVLIEKASISQDLLILAYFCVVLGYAGQYRQYPTTSLTYLSKKLHTIIQTQHQQALDNHTTQSPAGSMKNGLARHYWTLFSITHVTIGLGVMYGFFAFTLQDYSRTIVHLL